MDELQRIRQRHDGHIDSLIQWFEAEIRPIVEAALLRTQARLQEALGVTDGRIDRTLANTRVLRRLDKILIEEMERAGYSLVLDELAAQLPGQAVYLQQTIDALSASMVNPLPPVKFGPRDVSAFADQSSLVKDGLAAVMEGAAARARQQILLSVGGLRFPDLVSVIADSTRRGLSEAVGLAETATASFYRTIADRGYKLIEAETKKVLRYTYDGPLDLVTRPFCAGLLRSGRSYTRKQIDRMHNGQIPNVFISGGGWRCRHQWILSLEG